MSPVTESHLPGSANTGPKKIIGSTIVPEKFLNQLGFIRYDHYGRTPWPEDEAISLPSYYTAITPFLGVDCEMVGVGDRKDSALGRVSIVNEFGYCLYDTFVHPQMEITDYRTKFSGIRKEDLENAPAADIVVTEVGQLVEGKYLVGHSIHNDLEVLRLNGHPQVRDTSIYFQRLLESKTPPSLKQLTSTYLKLDIQGGEHSSIEDAQATMKLYTMFRDEWEKSYAERREKANLTSYISECISSPLDISEMHVSPREEDLYVDSKTVFVRKNKVEGAKYSSSEEYLDVQFRLLLEDFLRPLRTGVRTVKTFGKNGKRATVKIPALFYNVRIQGDNVEVKKARTLLIPMQRNNLTNVDWEESKLFKNGSLLLLTPDNFQSVKFAVVKYLAKNPRNDAYYLRLQIKFSKDGPSWITDENKDSFLMMESVAFYEAYKHTLEYLQIVKLDRFPMKKYIVDAATNPVCPHYMLQLTQKLNFSVLTKENCNLNAKIFDFANWPTANQLNLDISQYEALQKAMTQELTIIQGPPGTGKTFIGVQIAKLLLSNPWLLNSSPILIVSYTNHALDQTLELILDFITNVMCGGNNKQAELMVLRIGGGSKSEVIEPLTLFQKQANGREKNKLYRQIESLQNILSGLRVLDFKSLILDQGILNFEKLPKPILKILSTDVNYKTIYDQYKKICKPMGKDLLGWFGISECYPQQPLIDYAKLLVLPLTELEECISDILPLVLQLLSKPVSTLQTQFAKLGMEENEQEKYVTRWAFYFLMVRHVKGIAMEFERQLKVALEKYEDYKHFLGRAACIKAAKVVGMTTTGAVKYKTMVNKAMQPKIMIVEEAAHVLEAHVVASLTEHCQQLILIGDHKQLRPQTADYNLAADYQLDVSLMERLVSNGVSQEVKNWVQLKVQHRMRPEIARMVCPVIYEELDNHAVVYQYPDVIGCSKNIYFVDHQKEQSKEKGSSSYFNQHEANFLIDLANYFVKRGFYTPDQITIIVTYLDQKVYLDNVLKNDMHCSKIRVSTVDGYQGEENDIILLSLVRSNEQNNVGFLKTNNRVCVALSRARHGLFMIGNMSCLKAASETWGKISEILEEMQCIGHNLPLTYPQHPSLTEARPTWPTAKIIVEELPLEENLAVEQQPVSETPKVLKLTALKLSCGHKQKVTPRQMLDVDNIKCISVRKKALPCGHKQNMHCHQKPDTITCTQTVLVPLACKHNVSVACYKSRTSKTPKAKCQQLVKTTLPCGHGLTVRCHQKKLSFECTEVVEKQLNCGHRQTGPCHRVKESPCKEMVKKTLSCGHRTAIKFLCSENVSDMSCPKLKAKQLKCGHRLLVPCSRSPSDVKCIETVAKNLSCGHIQNAHCHQDPATVICNQKEIKLLSCGHLKTLACHDKLAFCDVMVERRLPCGHAVTLACNKFIKKMKCNVSVESKLKCGHLQKSPCHQRDQVKCNSPMSKMLRCKHFVNLPCHQDTEGISCTTLVQIVSNCKHKVMVPCHLTSKKPAASSYVNGCKKIFKCGHKCQLSCHIHDTKEHVQYKCMNRCHRSCPNNHPCPGDHLCNTHCKVNIGEGCQKCSTSMQKTIESLRMLKI